jgi:outer membrane protein assembly factor BamA
MRLSLSIFGLLVSLAVAAAPPAPIVRSIEVHSTDASPVNREELVSKLRTRVGEGYSEKAIEEDLRHLKKIGVPIVRIFGEPVTDGVAIIVVVEAPGKNTRVIESDEKTEDGKNRSAVPGH